MKFLGLDYGEKRIGMAISDEEAVFAFPRTTLENKPSVFAELKRICLEEGVGAVVLGLPVSFSGNLSEQARSVQRFGGALEAEAGIPVEYANELFSTKIGGTDAGAAAVILQGYLDSRRRKTV